ncbi:VCBS domain-containing protein, partial [Tenacibaculum sp. IB213877]|uniref:beta strand repeat-containing protein n=1 Tax=Tenacibaculum sp. IB213877 TaxID=3097351 RepID=UPI002A5AA02C
MEQKYTRKNVKASIIWLLLIVLLNPTIASANYLLSKSLKDSLLHTVVKSKTPFKEKPNKLFYEFNKINDSENLKLSRSINSFALPTIDLNGSGAGTDYTYTLEPTTTNVFPLTDGATVTSDTGIVTATINFTGILDTPNEELLAIYNGSGFNLFYFNPTLDTFLYSIGGSVIRVTQNTNTTFTITENSGGIISNAEFETFLSLLYYGDLANPYSNGDRVMSITIQDGNGDTASAQTTVRVHTTNIVDDVNSVSASNTGVITGNVLTNDSTSASPLIVDDVNLYSSVIGSTYSTLYGTITMQANGSYTYDVDETNPTVTGLRDGEIIQDIFSYTAVNSVGASDYGILEIDITGVTEPPVAQDNTNTVTFNVNNSTTGNVITDDGPSGADAIDRGLSTLTWENEFANFEAVGGQVKVVNGVTLNFTTEDINSIGTIDNQVVYYSTNGGHYGYLLYNIDPATNIPGATTDLTIAFSEPVYNLGFLLVDIDYSQATSWQDQIRIEGSLSGTASAFTYVTTADVNDSGNPTFYGTGVAPPEDATGNINVFFTEPIDQLKLIYSYGPNVTDPDPGGQIAGVSDIFWQDQSSVLVIELEGNVVPPATGLTYVGTYGTITINSDGTYSYTLDIANTDVNNLEAGQTLTETFNYVIFDGLNSDNANLIITINGTNCTASLPSSEPDACVNTVMTNITHTTAGATGIANDGVSGANGLPAGVSATWNADTITISGTPSAVGVFNYTIPLTGACTSGEATGTITVNALPTAGLSSSDADNTICAGESVTFTGTGGDVYEFFVDGVSVQAESATATYTTTGLSNGQEVTVRVVNTTTGCESLSTGITTTVDALPTTAAAGTDQTQCNTPGFTMAANTPTVGTGIWSIVSGTATIADTSSPTTGVTVAAGDTVTLRWTISNGSCTDSTDDVVLTNDALPTTAAAGTDQTQCNTPGFTMAANTPTVGTGIWSIVSGTATIADTSSPTTGV